MIQQIIMAQQQEIKALTVSLADIDQHQTGEREKLRDIVYAFFMALFASSWLPEIRTFGT